MDDFPNQHGEPRGNFALSIRGEDVLSRLDIETTADAIAIAQEECDFTVQALSIFGCTMLFRSDIGRR